MVTLIAPRKIVATATASATLARGAHTPVDATSGALTMTLPANAPAGVEISVEKVDASANTVTVSGTLRGAASSITMTSQYEGRTFLSDGAGSWRPVSDHRTSASLSATYASTQSLRAGSLFSRLAPADTLAVPGVSDDVPTISWSATATLSGRNWSYNGDTTELGSRGSWNPSTSRFDTSSKSLAGQAYFLTGTSVEFAFYMGSSVATTGQEFWLWINGRPHAVSPVTQTALDSAAPLTNSGRAFVKLTWATAKTRRIEFYAPGTNAWSSMVTPVVDHVVTRSPRLPVVAYVGDSYYGGSGLGAGATSTLNSAPMAMAKMLGTECFSWSTGGTGYTTGNGDVTNSFGGTLRVANVASGTPELIILDGSVNDDGGTYTAINTAAAATLAAYAIACPQAKIIVFGPQPSGAVNTVSANRATNNKAVRDAALAAPNVLAFHDQIGNADLGTVPATWGGSGAADSLAEGDRRVYGGAIWAWRNGGTTGNLGGTNKPGQGDSRFALLSYALTGTGRIGTTIGDGTRDVYLQSDNVHPTPAGELALAIRKVADIRADLRALTFGS